MPNYRKTYQMVLSGRNDHNINFDDLLNLVKHFGFIDKTRGDHHICRKDDSPIINLQPKGNKAKAYQVKQIRNIIVKYQMEV